MSYQTLQFFGQGSTQQSQGGAVGNANYENKLHGIARKLYQIVDTPKPSANKDEKDEQHVATAKALYAKAQEFEREKKYQDAFKAYKAAAELESIDETTLLAKVALGRCYLDGLGTERDAEKGLKLHPEVINTCKVMLMYSLRLDSPNLASLGKYHEIIKTTLDNLEEYYEKSKDEVRATIVSAEILVIRSLLFTVPSIQPLPVSLHNIEQLQDKALALHDKLIATLSGAPGVGGKQQTQSQAITVPIQPEVKVVSEAKSEDPNEELYKLAQTHEKNKNSADAYGCYLKILGLDANEFESLGQKKDEDFEYYVKNILQDNKYALLALVSLGMYYAESGNINMTRFCFKLVQDVCHERLKPVSNKTDYENLHRNPYDQYYCALYEMAQYYETKGKYETAIDLYAEIRGGSKLLLAANAIGRICETHHTKYAGANSYAAYCYYKEAATYGLAIAQFNLGRLYEHGLCGQTKNVEKAIYYYQKAANQGLRDAEFALGRLKPYAAIAVPAVAAVAVPLAVAPSVNKEEEYPAAPGGPGADEQNSPRAPGGPA